MLTRRQIQRLAQRNHIGMHTQERDYVQHLLLAALYAQTQTLVFKGGTAIRMIYRGHRYSEDLDFNGPDEVEALRRIWNAVVAEVDAYGVHTEIRNAWESGAGYSFDVSFHGPLYDGRDRSKGKVRIDLNRRPEPVETRRALVVSEYDDIRPFVVTVLTPEQVLAEKVRALMVRGKPRDLYDLWLLLRQEVRCDRDLIDRKLALYGLDFRTTAFDEALARVEADWERDLRPLLPQWVPFDDVRRDVRRDVEAMLGGGGGGGDIVLSSH